MSKKNKKQRIIFFLPVFTPGGASDSIVKLSKFLNDQNYSISVISIGKNKYKKYLKKVGCEVHEINNSRALFSIFALRRLIKEDLKRKYFKTILISNIHYANIVSFLSCYKLKGIKTIFTERSSLSELAIYSNFFNLLKNKLIFLLARYLYKFANVVITNSKFEKNYIKENFKVKNVICINPPSINKIEKKPLIVRDDGNDLKILAPMQVSSVDSITLDTINYTQDSSTELADRARLDNTIRIYLNNKLETFSFILKKHSN